MSNQITDPEILLELEIKWEEWDIIDYIYESSGSMCYYYNVIFKIKDKHYIGEVYDNGDECCSNFEDVTWYLAKLVITEKWVMA